jgi:hypothetical protein
MGNKSSMAQWKPMGPRARDASATDSRTLAPLGTHVPHDTVGRWPSIGRSLGGDDVTLSHLAKTA